MVHATHLNLDLNKCLQIYLFEFCFGFVQNNNNGNTMKTFFNLFNGRTQTTIETIFL